MINEYKEFTRTTAKYPGRMEGGMPALTYLSLGLCSEAGEVAGKVSKIMRGDGILDAAKAAIKKEIGDVLWYLVRIADELGIDIKALMAANMAKLRDRQKRGVIKGSGDDR